MVIFNFSVMKVISSLTPLASGLDINWKLGCEPELTDMN